MAYQLRGTRSILTMLQPDLLNRLRPVSPLSQHLRNLALEPLRYRFQRFEREVLVYALQPVQGGIGPSTSYPNQQLLNRNQSRTAAKT